MSVEDRDEPAPEDLQGYAPVPNHENLLQNKEEFEGWHHPRKQHVRIHQWCVAVKKLLRDLNLAPGEPFQYLTLPGNELLDVRVLHGVCDSEKVKLRYLGFNNVQRGSRAHSELNVSQNEVRALSSVDSFSIVIEDRLEAVANDRTQAFDQTMKYGPFHAINLDLCDSISYRDVDDRKGSILGVLGRLVKLQAQKNTPWLLFVTTKAEPGLVSDRSRQGFTSAIDVNRGRSEQFSEILSELISSSRGDLDTQIEKTWLDQTPEFLKLFSIGFGKWLLQLLTNLSPSWELILLDSVYYQSGPKGPDMLSWAFRCNTHVSEIQDPNGILPSVPPVHAPSETELAIEIAQNLQASLDLDSFLAGNPAAADKLLEQSARLLEKARFNKAKYIKWARDELRRPLSV